MAVLKRAASWMRQMLIAADQLAYVWIAGWFYVWLDRGGCPSADETISSRCGKAARAGARWGIVAAAMIDALFLLLTGHPNHCAMHIEDDEGFDTVASPAESA